MCTYDIIRTLFCMREREIFVVCDVVLEKNVGGGVMVGGV
jgi:hypothetical protein